MAIVNTASVVKTLKAATPTVNSDGKVISWRLEVEYSLNDYVSVFSPKVDIEEPSKAPSDYSKAELFALVDTSFLDEVYESQYTSVKMITPATETVVSDFNIDSLN